MFIIRIIQEFPYKNIHGAKTRQHTDHDKPYHKILPKYTLYQICDAHAYKDRNHHRKPNLRDEIQHL